ncbi:MAG: hypothetical protein DSY90_12685, partial [Deltaproteobacteria bacterium]
QGWPHVFGRIKIYDSGDTAHGQAIRLGGWKVGRPEGREVGRLGGWEAGRLEGSEVGRPRCKDAGIDK